MLPATPTVLYVEDEEADVLFMKRSFTKAGIGSAFQTVADGRAAIDYLSGKARFADRENHPIPDVVLLDLNLPELPGFEVLSWIRRHPMYHSLPVVIFSSSAMEDDRAKAEQLGANDYWHKPSSPSLFTGLAEKLRDTWLTHPPLARHPV